MTLSGRFFNRASRVKGLQRKGGPKKNAAEGPAASNLSSGSRLQRGARIMII